MKRIISISKCQTDSNLCNLVINDGQIKVATLVVPVTLITEIINYNL